MFLNDKPNGRNTMKIRLSVFSLLLGVAAFAYTVGCSARNEDTSQGSLKEISLQPYQTELLDIAFQAASAMPVFPHIKNRSRAQEMVVTACFELDQPSRASRYIEQIGNWRRGAGYADLALYYAQHGAKEKVESYLKLADRISEEAEDWRKDRIKVKIAGVYAYLGQTDKASRFEQGIEASEMGKMARIEAMVCPEESFNKKMEELDHLVSGKDFDIVKNALEVYPELYKRFYTNVERRALIEKKMKASWNNMPISVRIDLLTELVNFSLDRGDTEKALELVNEAGAMMDSTTWPIRFDIPLKARLAGLRYRSGDRDRARTEIQYALDMFNANREKIINIYRAGILRSIAEGYQAMGDITKALDLYKQALEAGIENPNSRPRAEDLTATCCSMALHAVEPSAGLLNRIREIRGGLGDPW